MVFIFTKKLEYVNVGMQLKQKQDNEKLHFDFFYLQFKDLKKYILINKILLQLKERLVTSSTSFCLS